MLAFMELCICLFYFLQCSTTVGRFKYTFFLHWLGLQRIPYLHLLQRRLQGTVRTTGGVLWDHRFSFSKRNSGCGRRRQNTCRTVKNIQRDVMRRVRTSPHTSGITVSCDNVQPPLHKRWDVTGRHLTQRAIFFLWVFILWHQLRTVLRAECALEIQKQKCNFTSMSFELSPISCFSIFLLSHISLKALRLCVKHCETFVNEGFCENYVHGCHMNRLHNITQPHLQVTLHEVTSPLDRLQFNASQ